MLVGEKWEQRIGAELQRSQFGLLLLSADFLHSPFIKDVELPAILAAGNAVPVGLEAVDLDAVDLRGIKCLQIFRLPVGRKRTPKCYADLGPQNRKRFVDMLVEQIAQLLLKRRP